MLQFDITEAPGYDVVLGLLWLIESNPTINWKERTYHYEGETPKPILMPIVRATLDMDDIIAITANEALEIIERRLTTMQILYCKKVAESILTLKIPAEYRDFKGLFELESDQEALPKHQPWDHEIKLQPGTTPQKQAIRPMSAEKAKILRKYIDDNLRRGLIRQSELLAGYLILMVYQNEKYRVCVDYRGLNEITIKNSYPLPLIHEL
jgi:hypothetical protein